MILMQGDAYPIPVQIISGLSVVKIDAIDTVEITIGPVSKRYPDDVTYDADAQEFIFPITQAESLTLVDPIYPVQARVKFIGGSVVGGKAGLVDISSSASKEVL